VSLHKQNAYFLIFFHEIKHVLHVDEGLLDHSDITQTTHSISELLHMFIQHLLGD